MEAATKQNYEPAEVDYMAGMKYKDIAQKYGVSLNTVKSWKTRYGWNKEKGVHTKSEKVCAPKAGAPPGNRNAEGHGAPKQNHNAEKHGLFRKWLPAEAVSIIEEMPKDPLDVLWDQIQIAYAAIIRAQQIMYVRDRDDMTTTKIGKSNGEKSRSEKWEVQQAWDKQATFMQAQARAQSELRSMIKQYDEQLHKNWELATEEQRMRIAIMKSQLESDKETPIHITFTKASEKHGGS